MSLLLQKPGAGATPIELVDRASFAKLSAKLPAAARQWMKTNGFEGAADRHVLIPDEKGALSAVWAGVHEVAHPYALSALPMALPPGHYRLGTAGMAADDEAAALSWSLGSYAFDLYKPRARAAASLALPSTPTSQRGQLVAEAINSTRDLVNTPAEHMGPAELAEAAKMLAKAHGAKFRQIVGDELLKANFPSIHAVGRAATRAPRLIEFNWGNPRDPKLVLVGKGVCFDSGGLDIKSAEGMRQMKKDMGGAAHVLALAQLIMALELPVRLQVLIPAVENAIAGNAYRPGDVFKTRKGLHIEIGNTDAEGRVILCDAMAYGAEGKPALMIDMATLTGAARVALGPQLPALFCRDMATARALVDRGLRIHDPVWHMPLWRDYHAGIESPIADIVNTGQSPLGGAINAALFLEDFVPADLDWLHFDIFASNSTARPGRPVGGEAQALRTLLGYLEERFSGPD
jgi:leucyl aminopeptidase